MAIVRVAMIPSLLTLGNFCCGFMAIVLSLHAVRDHTRARTLHEGAALAAPAAAQPGPPYEPGLRPNVATSSVVESGAGAGMEPSAPAALAAVPDAAEVLDRRIRFLEERSNDLFIYACLVVFLGMFFDTLDGRVARMTGSDSKFGAELDSLADASTFGLAPATILASMWIFAMPDGKSWWGQVAIFAAGYAACAALRLARYNVEIGSTDRNYFHGLPSPGAAGCVAATALAMNQKGLDTGFWETVGGWVGWAPDEAAVRALSVYTLAVGFLMVTRVTFIHVPNKYLSGRRKFTSLVLAVFLALLLVWQKEIALCLAFNGYVAWCLLHYFWRRGARRRLRPEPEISAP